MTWKYLVIAISSNEPVRPVTKISLQFEVAAETVSEAEEKARLIMKPFFEIDILEIRRV